MSRQRGFSLIEMIVAMAVILIVMGGVLQLLNQSQLRYVSTASTEDATSMAREALDQMVREVRLTGYPPQNSYPAGVITGSNQQYVTNAGGDLLAATNLPYSIHFEADINNNGTTAGDSTVTVVDYRLEVPTGGDTGGCAGLTVNPALTTPTLMRSAVAKNANGSAVTPSFEPFLPNVWNCTNNTAIFTYCPVGAGAGACPDLATLPASTFPRVVLIRLRVRGVNQDLHGQYQLVEFFGSAHRINPD